ncbi:uncharacterized protein [Prorops nasuta]|uniref:uncharacterized protein n=1 Tax=Prorops nasuta TaxID=863751 RepID=UPI0034CF607C
MQKPLRELGRLCLGAAIAGNGSETGNGIGENLEGGPAEDVCSESAAAGRSALPLLRIWPSESPRTQTTNQVEAFIFPDAPESVNDSGIESIQASPSPCAGVVSNSPAVSPQQSRRASFLHPDHARLQLYGASNHYSRSKSPSLPDGIPIDEEPGPNLPPSPSNSTTSSLRSMPCTSAIHSQDRRRSSKYSMFDALDLEYALLRAAARGSVGPYSLSESLHKLTFTQSLAFPALARGLASKQSAPARRPQPHTEGAGMNAFAKVVTALVLMLVSVLVFGVVYKFAKT